MTETKPNIQRIVTPAQLAALVREYGIPGDWHEPDQADISASVHGVQLDNAGFWPRDEERTARADDQDCVTSGIPTPERTLTYSELYLRLRHEGRPVADVNLATLLSWATLHAFDTGAG